MKIIVATGLTSGFGQSWLEQLDQTIEGKFFILGRSGESFRARQSTHPMRNEATFVQCDLASFESIHNAANEVRKQTDSIDVLINNAGVWSSDLFTHSADGIELTLAVNQLAPFMLIGKLIDLVAKSPRGRIVNTASFRYSDAKIDGHDIQLKRNYSAELAYCNSKLYSILLTRKLADLTAGSGITVNCFDPGIVDTPMLRQAFPKTLLFLYPWYRKYLARPHGKGAETGVFLSLSSSCSGISGEYFKDCAVKKTRRIAKHAGLSDWLWEESGRLTGFGYPTPIWPTRAKAHSSL